MKYFLIIFFCFLSNTIISQQNNCERIVIITIDGVRWQEIFSGVDSTLLFDLNKSVQNDIAKKLYWSNNVQERRKLLMPFFWSYIAENGQLFGNRDYGNLMQVKNKARLSYAGYNEIFTGVIDNNIVSNKAVNNKNNTVLEFLNNIKKNTDSVAIFASWQLFPYIYNEERSNLKINSGYNFNNIDTASTGIKEQSSIEKNICNNPKHTRKDMLTFIAAKEYLVKEKPYVMHIALGEADEFAHHKMYKEYISNLNLVDRMIAELWQTLQDDEVYKNKTTLIITTDHGRGSKERNWDKHGMLVKGSNQTWMAVIGNCIKPNGELKEKRTVYNAQIAETIANLMGETFIQNKKYSTNLTNLLQ
jgi:hypothetical protein